MKIIIEHRTCGHCGKKFNIRDTIEQPHCALCIDIDPVVKKEPKPKIKKPKKKAVKKTKANKKPVKRKKKKAAKK